IALAVSTAQVFAQLLRFYVLVPPAARPSLWELLDATAIGQLLNYATPLLVERAADVAGLFVMAAWASYSELRVWWLGVLPSAGTAWKVSAGVAVLAAVLALVAIRLPRVFGSFFGTLWGAVRSPRFAASMGVALLTWTLDAATL